MEQEGPARAPYGVGSTTLDDTVMSQVQSNQAHWGDVGPHSNGADGFLPEIDIAFSSNFLNVNDNFSYQTEEYVPDPQIVFPATREIAQAFESHTLSQKRPQPPSIARQNYLYSAPTYNLATAEVCPDLQVPDRNLPYHAHGGSYQHHQWTFQGPDVQPTSDQYPHSPNTTDSVNGISAVLPWPDPDSMTTPYVDRLNTAFRPEQHQCQSDTMASPFYATNISTNQAEIGNARSLATSSSYPGASGLSTPGNRSRDSYLGTKTTICIAITRSNIRNPESQRAKLAYAAGVLRIRFGIMRRIRYVIIA
ncbi:hypothetical protein I302_102571 [Kwoniella bestiolae CBS 10118]|uniref:Uncharacterized protein n=1 Tax=Kwoniella bestiolae CBS 10118 TaxID=1296100 RepID=A0A1B9GFK2_9TREE|nr:hypothetical protein I302_01258 [Kwoniella bestiolae CBS 10118]OCF29745.1 hypothetical protein I302_01258 [Kwoniella bestiolae CBS 10118]